MRLFPSFTASLLAAALLSATPARAQQGMHIDTAQPDFTAWAHFGGAQSQSLTSCKGFTYSLLHLTTAGSGDPGGAAFDPTPLALDFNRAFSFHFYIPVSQGLRGDGLTLTLATAPMPQAFTASNGLATDGHVVGWGAPLPVPVPEPGCALLLAGGAAALLGFRRLRGR